MHGYSFALFAPLRETKTAMDENTISGIILNSAFKIHTDLGPGLLESVYETILSNELLKACLSIQRQKAFTVCYNNEKIEMGFRADILVNNIVIIEIKSVESIAPVHIKRILTYLKISNIKLGLLINFNEAYLKNGIKRIVNNL